MDLAPCLLDADFVILVDTVKAAGEPGDTHVYQHQEILDLAPAPWLSPHDRDIRDALRTLASAGKGPADVLLVGVIPEWVATGVRLSQPVRAAVAPVIGLIVNELERLGYRLPMRTLPRQPDTWWEREAGTLAGVAG
jgi:hydrogenase maturation protease